MKKNDPRELAIIDANINRVGEGLRVIEDWSRFFLRDDVLTAQLKELRHLLWEKVSGRYPEIIKGRSTGEDILAGTVENTRSEDSDIPKASFNRVKEGLRVLEEMGKLISCEAGGEIKNMRFRIYEIEKGFYDKYTG
ncbi:MAG: thiamine-phosphate pyrophosphorylase [Elusimicrobiota bacterium]